MSDVVDLRRGTRSDQRAGLGMILFLVSWGVTFVALFLGYALIRVRQPVWPPPGTPSLGTVTPLLNTIAAVGSSVAFEIGLRSVRAGRLRRFQVAVALASLLALAFLALQLRLWIHLSDGGFNAGDSVYAGMFYMLTWFHAAHVVVALGLIGWLAPSIVNERYNARDHLPVRLTAWFWHFVTVAWIGVLCAVYII